VRLFAVLLLSWLSISAPACAATDVINVYFLPIEEAANAARSQLSDSGKVATIPSQRMLIIDDDMMHINKAKALLKRIDHAPGQYTAYLSIEDISAIANKGTQVSGRIIQGQPLSGGWLKLKLQHQKYRSNHRQSFQLRISSHQPGSIETGTIQSFNRVTRMWLAGYGLVRARSVELVPLTSGFHITASPVGNDQVRVRIVPWMKRSQPRMQGQQEMLIDLGSSNAPAMPLGNTADMRFNAQPTLHDQTVIDIAGAATELIMSVDESVTLAAANHEAENFGRAWLSKFSTIGKRQFVMRLRVVKD